ncbi:hypothetical protein D9756_009205 [Leucocoprinus leucothites]|uniref:Uncharacterized protein n=1 Tax=Leucocoprinus leucothites TaxID=201217 RepID=A0A8H5FU91_9AGAR|nr:hypothetical protein D9756_009205 [Leucoagaricus leucothites]
MTEIEGNDAEIYSHCSRFDVNLQEEASLILWWIWRSTRPQYSTQPACLDAIYRDPGLHDALKTAHNAKKYTSIRNWTEAADTVTQQIQDSMISNDIQALLDEMEGPLTNVINGRTSLPLWTPKDIAVQPRVRHHLENLKIPIIKGRPNLLLHQLGSFKHDPVLKNRLDNIFMPNNHTFLVNTSGSGKTRILLEGLCDKWGFYFTSAIDSSLLGSSDIQNSIKSYIPNSPNFRTNLPPSNYELALKNNRKIASKIFRQVLLARLIIFHHFVEIVERERVPHSSLDIYRERWLLLQLQPRPAHPRVWDIFDDLACRLTQASDHFIFSQTQDLLKRIRELCSERIDAPPEETPLFLVLDEAQFAATEHTESFRSDHNGSHRPILREIVRAWEESISGRGVFMVVAGTGISKDVVDQAMASAIMKDSRYRWCSDTGAFNNVEAQQQYLTKYLPKSLLDSESGQRLLERLWYWLRGRHRFTVGYVTELICNGFQQPHRLLNAYVQHFTGFSITDADDCVESEDRDPLPSFSQYKLDFSKLQKNGDMLPTIRRIITHYMMRSMTPHLGKDETMYVEYGFARFDDSETRVIVIDEPLVLLAATCWMNNSGSYAYKLLSHEISTYGHNFNGFENYITFCIDLIFSRSRRLSDVFTFHGTVPAWAKLEARLVSTYCPSSDVSEISPACFARATGSSVTLGMNAKTPNLTVSWLQNHQRPPFCFPHQSMGPDVIFVLQLSDQSLIWVALQTKWSIGKKGKLAKDLLLHAMKSVTPSKFFLDKNGAPFSPVNHPGLREDIFQSLLALPNRRTDAGTYSLLRVVASFPAQTRMKRYMEKDLDKAGHPIATFNMDLVKKVTQKLSPRAFLDGPGFQEALPSPKKEKRKRHEETVTRRKKLKI